MRLQLISLVAAMTVMLPACSSDKAPQGINAGVRPGESIVQSFPGQDVLRFRSRITYERFRTSTDASGIGPRVATAVPPARFVDVLAVDSTGAEIQTTACATGADGSFELLVPRGVPFRVVVPASTRNSGRVNLEVRDPLTTQRMAVTFNDPKTGGLFSFEPRFAKAEIELPPIAFSPRTQPPLVTDRPAGAFHILDSCVSAAEEVRQALGVTLPLLTIFWAPDSPLGSFFTESVTGFGPSIFLLGGDPNLDDTDESDASVIIHEFGHFASFVTMRDSSLGGGHGNGDVLYPSLAFSEGFANAFSGMVLNQAAYVDAAFVTDRPDFFVLNLENRASSIPPLDNLRGIRSEFSVGEICWDFVDGTGERLDSDGDGARVEFAPYLRALASLRNRPLYVSIEDALQALVDTGAIGQAALTTLLVAPENQQISFPPVGTDIFPRRITVNGGALFDTVQTRGQNDTGNTGLDVSSRFFQLTLTAATPVTFRPVFTSPLMSGFGIDSENIDMIVRTVDNALARDTAGSVVTPQPGPDGFDPAVSRTLAAGTYIVEISGRPLDAADNFSNVNGGTDVSYTLEVTSP